MMLRVMPSGWPYLAASGPVYCTAVFLGEDGDALLTFQIIGSITRSGTSSRSLNTWDCASMALTNVVLSVIDVCHNRYISNIAANRHRNLS